jgi:hypothetical protein
MSERTEIKFHINEIAPGKWEIIYDEPIGLDDNEHLLYEYDENDIPVKILKVTKNDR